MPIAKKDRDILRELAKEVAAIAALPVQQQTIKLHKALNSLKPVRPMVMIDQVAWNEMDVNGELAVKCEDRFCRGLETSLRRTLYSWKHMRADMVVEPVIRVSKSIRGLWFGMKVEEQTATTDPQNVIVGHLYSDQLQTEEDIEKIRKPQISLDEKATAETEQKAHEIFDGILKVEMQGHQPYFAPWDAIVTWRGAQNVLFDLADRPEFMHKIISRTTDAYISMLDQLEEKGLLAYGEGRIHCTGAYTDELPAPGFNPQRPRAKDNWTCGMAQIFSSVSKAMHKEYDIDYAVRWYSRFGLVYYGCCEPLHDKLDIVRSIPHVRKISMSPWVDLEKGAERIGKDFVFSRKPNPAFLAVDTFDPEMVEKDLKQTLDACKRHGCPVELILKDISTVRYDPQRLWQWVDIAMKLVGR
jgi:hypothetical protein